MLTISDKIAELTKKLTFPTAINGKELFKEYKMKEGTCYAWYLYEKTGAVGVHRWFMSKGTIFPSHEHKEKEWIIVFRGSLKLYTENKLDIEDKISKYLPSDLIQGLHLYNSIDYSNSITVAHLMSLTSGLPCYLIDKQADGKIAMKELESGIDQAWPIDKVIKEVKKMKPHFPPGE